VAEIIEYQMSYAETAAVNNSVSTKQNPTITLKTRPQSTGTIVNVPTRRDFGYELV
jgi:hypothetical protein